MTIVRYIAAVVLSLGLLLSQVHVLFGGMDQARQAERVSGEIAKLEPEVGQSKAFFALMQTYDTNAIRARMNGDYIDANFDLIMERVYLYLPQEAPKSVKPVGYLVRQMEGKRFVFVVLEYEFSDRWVVATVTSEPSNPQRLIAGFNLNTYSASLLERTKFRLSGQSIEHYILLGLAVLNLVFCAATLFVCIVAPRVRWRFLWIALILLGVGLMSFNWLEGRMALNIIDAGLPPTRLALELYQPLFIMLSIPLGAILFWMNFRRLTRA
ncbi:hypothetical protein [Asticcacaulis sp. YBE204]|uniref:hypothetical protein n=1 Tax=Asticcacaulis sp. YBE204 TaxID=1282363 RepID=UPI0003C40D68|nr:hypothetical protein [Asticcacaulis sp. YBE204]ESQ77769.1 hypothetical protein AEYBE204_16700 [Asticcacaulis sp. YBE204]